MESMGRAQALVRDLIMQCEWFFEKDEEVDENQEKAPEQVIGKQEQSVPLQSAVTVDSEDSKEGQSGIRPSISI